MFAVIVAALGQFVSWLLGASTFKWIFSAFLWFGLAALLDLLLDLLPGWFSTDGLVSASAVFTPEIWFFIDYFNVQLGLSLTFSAWVVRFLIRRIPFVG